MANIKVFTVKPTSKVSIEVSGAFLDLLNNCFINYMASLPNEEVVEAFMNVQKYKDNDDINSMSELGRDIYTLSTLINTIQNEFRKKGLTNAEEIDMDLTNFQS